MRGLTMIERWNDGLGYGSSFEQEERFRMEQDRLDFRYNELRSELEEEDQQLLAEDPEKNDISTLR